MELPALRERLRAEFCSQLTYDRKVSKTATTGLGSKGSKGSILNLKRALAVGASVTANRQTAVVGVARASGGTRCKAPVCSTPTKTRVLVSTKGHAYLWRQKSPATLRQI